MLELKQSDLTTAPGKKIVFAPKDGDGTPTTLENPACTSSNDLIVGVGAAEVVGNLIKFPLLPGDQHTTGIADLTLTGDAELGPGEEPLNFVVQLLVTPDNASGFDVTLE
jgi:hypothetical protein